MDQMESSGTPSPPQAQNGCPKKLLTQCCKAMPKHPCEVLVGAGNLSAE